MRDRQKIGMLVLSAFFIFLLSAVHPALAAVKVNDDFQGMLVITSSEGDVMILEQGDTMPEITPDANLEVFDGKFAVTTGQGDQVYAYCLNHDITVANGASISLACGEESGMLEVLKGAVKLIDDKGLEHALNEGATFPIQLSQLNLAAPTAQQNRPPGAGQPPPGQLGNVPPPDPRNFPSSPGK